MTQTTKVFVGMLVVAAVLVVGFFVVGPMGDPVFASPQDVFKAAKDASMKDNVKTWCQCLTDESRDMFVMPLVLSIPPVVMQDKDPKSPLGSLGAILARHGLKPAFLANAHKEAPAALRQQTPIEEQAAFANAVLTPVSDRNGLAHELSKALKSHGMMERDPMDVWRESTLGEVKISGSTAIGLRTIAGGPVEPVHFRKQGEGWRIDLLVERGPPKMPFGHPPIR